MFTHKMYGLVNYNLVLLHGESFIETSAISERNFTDQGTSDEADVRKNFQAGLSRQKKYLV